MTSKLYYDDPQLLEFDATVRSVDQKGGLTLIELDRTAFYPEGGGQPADRGMLAGREVVHVRKDGERVIHVVEAGPEALKPGQVVTGSVDPAHRREFMQQHTGQHIISAALLRTGGHNTVSVHLGDDYATIEVDSPSIPDDELAEIEDEANRTVMSAIPVTSQWVDESEIDQYALRRQPKVSGKIRLVRIGDVDCVACGGVHVGNTSEVRLVRLLGAETIRGNARVAWKIGDRAIEHYRLTSTVVARLVDRLSAQPAEIVERVERQEDRLKALEAAIRRERESLYHLTARSLATDAGSDRRRIITAEFSDEHADFLRGVSKELSRMNGVSACLTNRAGDRLQWSIAVGPAAGVAPDTFLKEILPLIDGKGGGRPPLWQGVGTRLGGSSEFFRQFRACAGG